MPLSHYRTVRRIVAPTGEHEIASVPTVQVEGDLIINPKSALEHQGVAEAEVVLDVTPTGDHQIGSLPTITTSGDLSLTVASALEHQGSAETSVQQTVSPTGQHAILGDPNVTTEPLTEFTVNSALQHIGSATVTGGVVNITSSSYTYDPQTDELGWSVAWEGGMSPFDIYVYEDEQKSVQIDEALDVQSSPYSETALHRDPGGDIWIEVIDDTGNSDFEQTTA